MAFIQCLFYCHLIGCRCGHWQRGGSPEIGHWKVGLSFEVKTWTALDDERWLNRLNWNRTFFRFMFCFGLYHSTTWYVKLKISTNIWCNKNRINLSCVLLMWLVRFLMHQTLVFARSKFCVTVWKKYQCDGNLQPSKGQWISQWIYDSIVSPKIWLHKFILKFTVLYNKHKIVANKLKIVSYLVWWFKLKKFVLGLKFPSHWHSGSLLYEMINLISKVT